MRTEEAQMQRIFLLFFFVLAVSSSSSSQWAVRTLPGFNGNLPFNLETGYVGVGYKEELQLFYYFMESERSPEDDPLVLWLLGGPGCSALSAIVYQNGPLVFNYVAYSERRPIFLLNPYSWTKIANIIYLDAPVGTGFSYSTSQEGKKTGDLSSAAQSYEFLRKWLMAHPKFQSNPLYIGGDSYAGIPIPILVQDISDGIDRGDEPSVNLKGFILGNPGTDLFKYDFNSRLEVARRLALIPDELYKSTKEHCKGLYMRPDRSNLLCVSNAQAINDTFIKLYDQNLMEPKCSTWHLSSLLGDNPIDALATPPELGDWCRNYYILYSEIWANNKDVQKALHVREGTIQEWIRCKRNLPYSFDAAFSSLKYHRNLTKRAYRILIYSGDHDLTIPFEGTKAWIESLNLTVSENWRPWFVDGHFAGKVITYSRKKYRYDLTFATIKGGAHTASENKPRECFSMVDRWFAGSPL